nr:DUF1801 domain-containing protein [Candidatus Viadribacter manganicus]
MAKKPAKKAAPKLLNCGDPQIANGHGYAPAPAYIAAMPDWTRAIDRKVDQLITRAVPKVKKAVKYDSPLYGLDGKTWFVSMHVFARHLKVAFFKGALLDPASPGASKQKHVRYLDIHQDDEIDEAQIVAWVKQANKLPGEKLQWPNR